MIYSKLISYFLVAAMAASTTNAVYTGDQETRLRKTEEANILGDVDTYLIVLKKNVDSAAVNVAGRRRGTTLSDIKGYHEYFGAIQEANTIVTVEGLTKREIDGFKKDNNVLSIEKDGIATAQESEQDLDYAGQWGLDRIDTPDPSARDDIYNYGATGAGVDIYVVDTGVRNTHDDFDGRAGEEGYGIDFTNNGNEEQEDCNGHGSHVASTAAGSEYGVAKGASIIPVKVLNCAGSGSWSGIISSMDWIIEHNDNSGRKGVVSMSLGGGGVNNAVIAAVENIHTAGMLAVVAAGNSNSNACNFTPAAAPNAITVGSITKNNDNRSGFSNYGDCLDIYAPGSDIKAAWKDGDSSTNTISGTSMATPHVTGVVAVLWELYPNYTNEQIEEHLLELAVNSVPGQDQRVLQSTAEDPEEPELETGCKTEKIKNWGNSRILSKELGGKKNVFCVEKFEYKGETYNNECVTEERTPKFGKRRNKKPKKYLKKIQGWCFTSKDKSTWAACNCEE